MTKRYPLVNFASLILCSPQALAVNGGGGAGGRIAVYFKSNRTFSGSFEALGGNGQYDGYTGGPGTIFFYHLLHKHRTLMISNAGRKPLTEQQQVMISR